MLKSKRENKTLINLEKAINNDKSNIKENKHELIRIQLNLKGKLADNFAKMMDKTGLNKAALARFLISEEFDAEEDKT